VSDRVQPGDIVALGDDEGARVLLRVEGGARKVRGVGILAPERLAGLSYGARVEHASRAFRVLRPGVADLVAGIDRKAQIVLAKDASRIVFECDVRSGARVVEAGAGSGALTTVLAWAVAPTGRVTTYELREDFAAHARANLEVSGLAPLVDIKIGDVTKGIAERDVDAVVLDMPNPWDAVEAAAAALRPDGRFAAYTPLVSQVEKTRQALAARGFFDVRTLELIERPWVVHEHGARPDFQMLGHTAFLTFARKGVDAS
jgi:tRNA (adenine57-N1/adenine58-N1)-methyltransferase